MKGRFWKVCAALLVMLAAVYMSRPLWAPAGSASARYAEAGGGINGVISFPGTSTRDGKVYIVDSDSKVVLVYAACRGANSFELMAGRCWASDSAACRTGGLTYNQRGYTVIQSMNFAIQAGGGGRR